MTTAIIPTQAAGALSFDAKILAGQLAPSSIAMTAAILALSWYSRAARKPPCSRKRSPVGALTWPMIRLSPLTQSTA